MSIFCPDPTSIQAPLAKICLTLSNPLQVKDAALAGLANNHLESTLYFALTTLTQKLSHPDSTHQASLAIIASLKLSKERKPKPPSERGLQSFDHAKGVKNLFPSDLGFH